MIDHADNVFDLNAILHPGSVYDHPRDVVADQTISIGEKRAILASWASDAAAVASNPALRELPGSRRLVTIDDVLEALSALDHHPKARPAANRPARSRPRGLAWQRRQAIVKGRTTMTDENFALLRTHRNNISRYRRLLKTKLTEFERQFIEGRLSEERSAMERIAASTFPLTFRIPMAVDGGPMEIGHNRSNEVNASFRDI